MKKQNSKVEAQKRFQFLRFLLEQAAGKRNQYIKIHYSLGLNGEEEEEEEVEAETVTKSVGLEKASPKIVQLCIWLSSFKAEC